MHLVPNFVSINNSPQVLQKKSSVITFILTNFFGIIREAGLFQRQDYLRDGII